MKKLLMTVLMLVGAVTFASVEEPFKQFAREDYHSTTRNLENLPYLENLGWQKWDYLQVSDYNALFTLSVKGGTGVWLSNYVSNVYGTETPNIDGGDVPLDKNTYNMSPKAYGYIYAKDMPSLIEQKGSYDNLIHLSNGATTDITYTSDTPNGDGTYKSITTPGYFLDYFKDDAEIYLVMTTLPVDGVEMVDSYQYTQDAKHETILYSRQFNTADIAGNIRVDFGIDNGTYGKYEPEGTESIAREFVAVYSEDKDLINKQLAGGSGGPLPGVFFAGLLSLGTVFGASKAKRQKRA